VFVKYVTIFILKSAKKYVKRLKILGFFEQEVLLTMVHIGTRRNNVVLPRFSARSPDRRSGRAVGSPRMLGRGRSVSPLSEGDANKYIIVFSIWL
jgi:hypothetical protein